VYIDLFLSYLVVHKHSSTYFNSTGNEIIIDYITDFTTYEIFQNHEALIKWAREVGKSHEFMIIIKHSNLPINGKKRRVFHINCK